MKILKEAVLFRIMSGENGIKQKIWGEKYKSLFQVFY